MKTIIIFITTMMMLSSCENTTHHDGRYFYGNDGKLYKAVDAQCVDCYRLQEVKDMDTAFTKFRINK